MSAWRKYWFSSLLLAAISCLTLGPVLVIAIMSLDVSPIGEPFQFGLSSFFTVFQDPENLKAFLWSFILTLRVPIGMFCAIIIAWLLVRVRIPGSKFFEFSFWFAYFLPALPLLYGWILLLDENYGLFNTWAIATGITDTPLFNIRSAGGIIWAHLTIQTIPIMVILITPAMRMIDRSLEDAAIISGASSAQILHKIILPLALPALLVAGAASWIKALESFEMEQVLGVPIGIYVYSNKIYDFVLSDPPLMAEAMSLSLTFLIILIGLGAGYQTLKRHKQAVTTLADGKILLNSSYSKTTKYLGFAALLTFVIVTIGLPFLMLLAGSFMKLFGFLSLASPWTTDHWSRVINSSEFQNAAIATLELGFSTAAIGVIIFSIVAWGLLSMGPKMRSVSELMIWLPWAIPGIIVGVSLLEITLSAPGFSLLRGTIVPMIVGILITQMPIGVHLLRVSFQQVNHDLLHAAQLTGASLIRVWGRIVWPLNAPAMTVVFLLIFASAISEISVLVLIAPPGMSTLSILNFKYASLGNFESASVVGTIVALLALTTSLIAFRIANRLGVFE